MNLVFGRTLASCSTSREEPAQTYGGATGLVLSPSGTPIGSPVRPMRMSSNGTPGSRDSPTKSVLGATVGSFASAAGGASTNMAGPCRRAHKLEVPVKLRALLEVVYKLKKEQSQTDSPSSTLLSQQKQLVDPTGPEEDQRGGDGEGEESLGVSVLRLAAEYFCDSRQAVEGIERESGLEAAQQVRGGNNIWQKGEQMLIGDLVDAMDKEKCWFEAIITEVRPGMNIKVHFMGWGSKWDDIVTIDELETRIAPLNTQTNPWRTDLFEGGLIEIKCNEDTVNQKWMWGKIIAMSIQEEWVDVSYSFSNEPVILKRAHLYGETICPIGMHTKERSKAVSATIVRPPQRADEIVKAKDENIDDAAFYDRDDELVIYDLDEGESSEDDDNDYNNTGGYGLESIPGSVARRLSKSFSNDPQSLYSPHARARASSLGSQPVLRHSKSYMTELHSDSNPMDIIAKQVFEVILREVISAVTCDVPASAEDIEVLYSTDMIEEVVKQMSQKSKFQAAVAVLKALITGPYKRLLAPYFCRVITVQCGIRAKLLVQTYVEQSPSEVQRVSDFLLPSMVLRKVRALEYLYSQLTVSCLGDFLSVNLMRRVVQRISATTSQCARAVIAADFITQLSNSNKSQLQQVFVRDFLESKRRMHGRASALRGVLSNLLKVSKAGDQRRLASVWIGVLRNWVSNCCEEYSSQQKAVDHTAQAALMQQLVDKLLNMLATARSASRLEFGEAKACNMAAEIAFHRAFSMLPQLSLLGISRALALEIASLLDTSNPHRPVVGVRLKKIDALADFVGVVLDEQRSMPFKSFYEHLLCVRLLHLTYSFEDEMRVMATLPPMPRALLMLQVSAELQKAAFYTMTITHNHRAHICHCNSSMIPLMQDMRPSSSFMPEFKKSVMVRMDKGLLSLDASRSLALVVRRAGSDCEPHGDSPVNIRVLSSAVWPARSTMLSVYHCLKLPPELEAIRAEFSAFYRRVSSSWDARQLRALFGGAADCFGLSRLVDAHEARAGDTGIDDFLSGSKQQGLPSALNWQQLLSHFQRNFGFETGAAMSNTDSVKNAVPTCLLPSSGTGFSSSNTRAVNGAGADGAAHEEGNRQRKLFWCYGSGAVRLSLKVGSVHAFSVSVNEPLAAILMAFNTIADPMNSGLTTGEICGIVGLDCCLVEDLLAKLCTSSPALLVRASVRAEEHYTLSPSLLEGTRETRTKGKQYAYAHAVPEVHVRYMRVPSALSEKEDRFRDELLDATIVRTLKRAHSTHASARLQGHNSSNIKKEHEARDAFLPVPPSSLRADGREVRGPLSWSADELCVKVQEHLQQQHSGWDQAKSPHQPNQQTAGSASPSPHPRCPMMAAPVSSSKIIERCESLVLSGLLQKVKYVNSGSVDSNSSTGTGRFGLHPPNADSVSLHCIGYMYAADQVPAANGDSVASGAKCKSTIDKEPRDLFDCDVPAPSAAAVFRQVQQQMETTEEKLPGRISLPAFSRIYIKWLVSLPLQSMQRRCAPLVPLNFDEMMFARPPSASPTEAGCVLSKKNGRKRWANPELSRDIRALVNSLALAMGVGVTHMCDIEHQYRNRSSSTSNPVNAGSSCDRMELTRALDNYHGAVLDVHNQPLTPYLDSLELYRLIFEHMPAGVLKAALRFLSNVSPSSDVDPLNRFEGGLDTSVDTDSTGKEQNKQQKKQNTEQLLRAVRFHWNRKRPVALEGLEDHCRRDGIGEDLAAALQFVVATQGSPAGAEDKASTRRQVDGNGTSPFSFLYSNPGGGESQSSVNCSNNIADAQRSGMVSPAKDAPGGLQRIYHAEDTLQYQKGCSETEIEVKDSASYADPRWASTSTQYEEEAKAAIKSLDSNDTNNVSPASHKASNEEERKEEEADTTAPLNASDSASACIQLSLRDVFLAVMEYDEHTYLQSKPPFHTHGLYMNNGTERDGARSTGDQVLEQAGRRQNTSNGSFDNVYSTSGSTLHSRDFDIIGQADRRPVGSRRNWHHRRRTHKHRDHQVDSYRQHGQDGVGEHRTTTEGLGTAHAQMNGSRRSAPVADKFVFGDDRASGLSAADLLSARIGTMWPEGGGGHINADETGMMREGERNRKDRDIRGREERRDGMLRVMEGEKAAGGESEHGPFTGLSFGSSFPAMPLQLMHTPVSTGSAGSDRHMSREMLMMMRQEVGHGMRMGMDRQELEQEEDSFSMSSTSPRSSPGLGPGLTDLDGNGFEIEDTDEDTDEGTSASVSETSSQPMSPHSQVPLSPTAAALLSQEEEGIHEYHNQGAFTFALRPPVSGLHESLTHQTVRAQEVGVREPSTPTREVPNPLLYAAAGGTAPPELPPSGSQYGSSDRSSLPMQQQQTSAGNDNEEYAKQEGMQFPPLVNEAAVSQVPQAGTEAHVSRAPQTLLDHVGQYLEDCTDKVLLTFAPLVEMEEETDSSSTDEQSKQIAVNKLCTVLLDRMAACIASLQYEASKDEVSALIEEEAPKEDHLQTGQPPLNGSGQHGAEGRSGVVQAYSGRGERDEEKESEKKQDSSSQQAQFTAEAISMDRDPKDEHAERSQRVRRRMFKSSLVVMVEALFATLDSSDKGFISLETFATEELDAHHRAENQESEDRSEKLSRTDGGSGDSEDAAVLDPVLSDLMNKTLQSSTSYSDPLTCVALIEASSAVSAVEADFPTLLADLSSMLRVPAYTALFQLAKHNWNVLSFIDHVYNEGCALRSAKDRGAVVQRRGFSPEGASYISYPLYREHFNSQAVLKRKAKKNACRVIFSTEITMDDDKDSGSDSEDSIVPPACLQCETVMTEDKQHLLLALPCHHWHCRHCWSEHITKEHSFFLDTQKTAEKEYDVNCEMSVTGSFLGSKPFAPSCPCCPEAVSPDLARQACLHAEKMQTQTEMASMGNGTDVLLLDMLRGLLQQRLAYVDKTHRLHDMHYRLDQLVLKRNAQALHSDSLNRTSQERRPSQQSSLHTPQSTKTDSNTQSSAVQTHLLTGDNASPITSSPSPERVDMGGSHTGMSQFRDDYAHTQASSSPATGRKRNAIDTELAVSLVRVPVIFRGLHLLSLVLCSILSCTRESTATGLPSPAVLACDVR